MHSVAVYLHDRAYGGREEGGWWYDCYDRSSEPELLALAAVFPTSHQANARAAEIQMSLNADWNVGHHRHSVDSVLSRGQYIALVHEGWPPSHLPEKRPTYE